MRLILTEYCVDRYTTLWRSECMCTMEKQGFTGMSLDLSVLWIAVGTLQQV